MDDKKWIINKLNAQNCSETIRKGYEIIQNDCNMVEASMVCISPTRRLAESIDLKQSHYTKEESAKFFIECVMLNLKDTVEELKI